MRKPPQEMPAKQTGDKVKHHLIDGGNKTAKKNVACKGWWWHRGGRGTKKTTQQRFKVVFKKGVFPPTSGQISTVSVYNDGCCHNKSNNQTYLIRKNLHPKLLPDNKHYKSSDSSRKSVHLFKKMCCGCTVSMISIEKHLLKQMNQPAPMSLTLD